MEYIKLEEVCEKATSNISQKDLEDNFGEYPVYGASGLIKNIDFYKQEKEYIAIVKDGAGIGRTMLLPAKSSVIGTLQYIIPNDKLDIKYLYYAITSMKLSKYFSGATIPHIYFKDYKREKIPFVTRENQKKISRILSKIEKIIEEKKEQLELLENLKKSQFFELFGDPIKNDKDWKKVKLSDVAKIIMGQSPPSSSYNEKGIGMPFYQGNVDFGEKYPKIKKYTDKITKIANENTILMSVRAPVGELNVTKIECCIGRGVCSIKINGELNLEYLFYYLKNIMINIKKLEKGSTFKSINKKEIENIEVLLPPLELQNKFATKIEAIQKLKFEIEKSLKETENLYNSLMQKFFSNK